MWSSPSIDNILLADAKVAVGVVVYCINSWFRYIFKTRIQGLRGGRQR